MPVVRIDDATWERLKRWAVPLEDTPADAVRKILDLADEHLRCTSQPPPNQGKLPQNGAQAAKRLPKGQKVPQDAYHRPILEALYELGGKGRMADVLDIVGRKMNGVFGDVDKQPLRSGRNLRWRNTAQWARFQLVQRGLLKKNSQRGLWELTEQGIKLVESRKGL